MHRKINKAATRSFHKGAMKYLWGITCRLMKTCTLRLIKFSEPYGPLSCRRKAVLRPGPHLTPSLSQVPWRACNQISSGLSRTCRTQPLRARLAHRGVALGGARTFRQSLPSKHTSIEPIAQKTTSHRYFNQYLS